LVSFAPGARLGPYEVCSLTGSGGTGEVFVHPLVSGSALRDPFVSPDGRRVLFGSNRAGAMNLFSQAGHVQVSTNGGTQPLWARAGQELFYVAPEGALMRVNVASGPAWKAGSPTKVLEGRYVVSTAGNFPRNYDLAGDGQRLMLKAAVAARPARCRRSSSSRASTRS
jgi:hypothetical protein